MRRANGDADVVIVLINEIISLDLRVDLGDFLEGNDTGLDEERHEAKPHPVLLLEDVPVLGTQSHDGPHVRLVECREDGSRILSVLEALRDAPPQPGHRHPPFALTHIGCCNSHNRVSSQSRSRDRCCWRCLQMSQNIPF